MSVHWTVHSWERGYRRARDPDVRVWIDINAFDHEWWRSDQYIVVPGDASDNQPEKYAKAGKRFLAGEPMWMPEVCMDPDGILSFRDGRHRYLWMREHGALSMEVAVSKSQAKAVTRLCGTRRRTSWFIPPRPRLPKTAIFVGVGLIAGLFVAARL